MAAGGAVAKAWLAERYTAALSSENRAERVECSCTMGHRVREKCDGGYFHVRSGCFLAPVFRGSAFDGERLAEVDCTRCRARSALDFGPAQSDGDAARWQPVKWALFDHL